MATPTWPDLTQQTHVTWKVQEFAYVQKFKQQLYLTESDLHSVFWELNYAKLSLKYMLIY
jgi:hypothetical protein